MRKFYVAFFCFFVFFSLLELAFGASVFDYETDAKILFSKMPDIQSTKCTFRQNKKIPGVLSPFVSGGEFIFSKGLGVVFKTTYTVQSPVTYSVKENRRVNAIVASVLDKNYSVLNDGFKLYFKEPENPSLAWNLALAPKDSNQLKKYLESVQILGKGDYIFEMLIKTPEAGETKLEFSNCRKIDTK